MVHFVCRFHPRKQSTVNALFFSDMRHLKLSATNKISLMGKIVDFIQDESSQTHKLTTIEQILNYAPSLQRFVLVGDSSESDPEVRRMRMKRVLQTKINLDLRRNRSKLSCENSHDFHSSSIRWKKR